MRLPASVLILISALSPAFAADAADEGGGDSEQILDFKDHYTRGFELIGAGQYGKAIEQYNEVLKIDPNQKTAQKMIRTAREKIDERDKKEQGRLFGFASQGNYQAAFLELQPLLDRDPTHPLYEKLQTRLELVVEIVKKSPDRKAWLAAVRGLRGYITREDDLQLAYNGLRHARDLDSKEARFAQLEKLILKEDPKLAEEKITPGMKLLEYKRFVALNQIYDGKYHLAIENLNQVIALEPADLLSLKRLGSAYYALKRYKQAESVWERALKLTPNDKELRKFLTLARNAQAPSGRRR